MRMLSNSLKFFGRLLSKAARSVPGLASGFALTLVAFGALIWGVLHLLFPSEPIPSKQERARLHFNVRIRQEVSADPFKKEGKTAKIDLGNKLNPREDIAVKKPHPILASAEKVAESLGRSLARGAREGLKAPADAAKK
jgi:hypothetical protein